MNNPFQSSGPAPNSFLPEDYVAHRTDVRANVLTLTLFAIVMAGVVAAFFVTNRHWQSLRQHQQGIEADYQAEAKKIDQLRALETQRESIMEKAEITAALVEKIPRWAILGELTLRMPPSMRLDQFVIKSTRIVNPANAAAIAAVPGGKAKPQSLAGAATKPGEKAKKPEEKVKVEAPKFEYLLTIEGTTDENNDVADFLTSLKRSPLFDRVELPFIRDAKELGKEMRKFQVTASLRQNVGTGELSASLQDLVTARATALAQKKLDDSKNTPASRKKPASSLATAPEGTNP